MHTIHKLICTCLFLGVAAGVTAQSAHRLQIEGDRQYKRSNFREAEDAYRRAAEKKPDEPRVSYNAGNASYRQGNYADSEKYFDQSAQSAKNPTLRADALHNLGNTYLKQQKYQEAIDAYQNSLRLRPGDPESKANLQLAKKKLQEQQQQNQQNQQQNQQQDQSQQQQPSDQQSQKQDQQPQEPQNQPEQNQPSQGNMTPEQARRLLETAVGPEDQKNARKYREQEPQKRQSQPKKDW